jgi:LysM repeat protein
MRRIFLLIVIGVFLTTSLLIPIGNAQAAGSVSGADMIAMMNSWRSNYWSNALIENASLNSCAQWTAEEMARNNYRDHLSNLNYVGATSRCAGFGFGGGKTVFVTENWAAHYNMTIDILAGYWSDYWHMLPATSEQYRYVGVGIATASDGKTYYILQAGAISGEAMPAPYATSSGSTSSQSVQTSNFVQPVLTATPNEDGDTYHIVQYGQALFTIATWYGVTVEEIKSLNSLTSDAIYEGQKLLIRIKPTVTITPTRTATVAQPTRTLTSTQSPPTPRSTVTATPTPRPSLGGFVKEIDRQYLGFGILLISAVGFLIVFYSSFLKPKVKK